MTRSREALAEALVPLEETTSRALIACARKSLSPHLRPEEVDIAATGYLLMAAGRMLGLNLLERLSQGVMEQIKELEGEALEDMAIEVARIIFNPVSMEGPHDMMSRGVEICLMEKDFADDRRGGE